MIDNERGAFLSGVFLTLTAMIIIITIILKMKTEDMQKEAIKANVAEYYIDENNEKQFRYLQIKKAVEILEKGK